MRQQLGGPGAADHIARRHAGHAAVIHQCGAGHQGALRAHLFPVAAQQLHHVPWLLQGGNRVHHISKLRRQAHIVFQHHQRGGVAGQQLLPCANVAGIAALFAVAQRLVVLARVQVVAVPAAGLLWRHIGPPHGRKALAGHVDLPQLGQQPGAALGIAVEVDEDDGQAHRRAQPSRRRHQRRFFLTSGVPCCSAMAASRYWANCNGRWAMASSATATSSCSYAGSRDSNRWKKSLSP